MPDKVRWGVVATVAEPAPLVMAFVAHHLSLGASEIHIYCDDPHDPVADTLEWLPPVHVTRCNMDYWRNTVTWKPKRHNNRQSANASHAQSKCKVPFLLHCDADEFLRPRSDVAAQLAEVPEHLTWAKIFNLERAVVRGAAQASVFDGVFKVFYQGQRSTPLHTSDMTPMGFTGHAAGKPFVRTKIGMNIGIHVPRHGHIKARVVPPHHPADQVELVHFDGMTPLHWAAKFVRQAALIPDRLQQLPPFRIAQWQRIFACLDDPDALRLLYDEINGYTPEQIDTLEDDGYITRDTFNLTPALEAVFPGQTVDLSPDTFDALLRPRVTAWRKIARRNGVEI